MLAEFEHGSGGFMVFNVRTSFSPPWRTESGLLVVFSVMLLSQSGFADFAPDLSQYIDSEDTARRLDKGDLVVFKSVKFEEIFGVEVVSGARGSLVLFLVSKPPVATWNLLCDFDEHRNYLPHVTESKVLWSDENKFCILYRYERLWMESTNYLIARCDNEAMTIVWHADTERSDKRIDGMNVFWKIQRYDENRTLVAVFRNIKHSGAFSLAARKLLVSPRSGAKAIRDYIESYNQPSD